MGETRGNSHQARELRLQGEVNFRRACALRALLDDSYVRIDVHIGSTRVNASGERERDASKKVKCVFPTFSKPQQGVALGINGFT